MLTLYFILNLFDWRKCTLEFLREKFTQFIFRDADRLWRGFQGILRQDVVLVLADQKADSEHEKFKSRAQYSLSPVEIHFIDQFLEQQKALAEKTKKESDK